MTDSEITVAIINIIWQGNENTLVKGGRQQYISVSVMFQNCQEGLSCYSFAIELLYVNENAYTASYY